ncbi:hypothetical protein BGX34_001767, partial [Mortierella sp. NVP85]
MSSFVKADPTHLPLATSARPTPTSSLKNEDDDRQSAFYKVRDEAYAHEYEEDEEGEEYDMEDEEMVGSDSEMATESELAGGQDADMADISDASSSRPSDKDSGEMPSRKRPASPDHAPYTMVREEVSSSSSTTIISTTTTTTTTMDASSLDGQAESPPLKNAGVGFKKDTTKPGVAATSCANCGTTSTPLWRRA